MISAVPSSMTAFTPGICCRAKALAFTNADIKPKRTPCVCSNVSLYSLRNAMTWDMSTSWNVVSMAVVFCASFSLLAMLCRIRVILTRLSPLEATGASAAGLGVVAAGFGAGLDGAAAAGAAAAGAGLGGAAAALGGASPPGFSTARAWPTSTVESGSAKISTSVPFSSAFTSTLTLSVSMTARISPLAQKSPTCFCHSMSVPSVMDSAPNSGVLIWIVPASAKRRTADKLSVARLAAASGRATCGRRKSCLWALEAQRQVRSSTEGRANLAARRAPTA
mmetsp:Transcript_74768/g.230991  ORF Transcript_74768/g.230991 Transcript_74768/m.230991 type:complete len:279 (+) Transcript_74768:558-1394(+)